MSALPFRSDTGTLSATADEAAALFEALAPCGESVLRGRWAGHEVRTGHPLDGMLANVSWYGKQFDGPTRVHPLLVAGRDGNPFPLNPDLVPMLTIRRPPPVPRTVTAMAPTLMSALRPAARARRHGAHLTMRNLGGFDTAAMVYDTRPIVDVFKKVDDDTVLGLMEYPGMPRPYFFVLQRDS